MNTIKHSLGLALTAQYADMAIQFAGVMVLARIITPEEIGVYSVAAFLMTILHVFRDFGVGKYIIQAPNLTNDKIRSAYGVCIVLALSIALTLLACSSFLAKFYGEPRISGITTVMAASFAITPLGSLLIAIFRRDMQFKKIFLVRVSSALCHVATAIILAANGHGPISLAWANFSGILVFGIVAILLRSPHTPWLPSFKNIREILSFGSVASLGSVAGAIGNNAPDVIIGKVIDLGAAGYFSRANGLIQIFKTLVQGAVLPLVLPYFSILRRNGGDISHRYHLAVAHLTVFAWPFFAVLGLLALPIVRTLYGPQWDISVPVVQILCLAGAVGALSTFAGEVMIAYGHIRQVTITSLLTQPIRIAAILIASPMGLKAVAIAIVISECLTVAITSFQLYKTTGVTIFGVFGASTKSATVTLFSDALPTIANLAFSGEKLFWAELVTGLFGALIGWISGIYLTKHPAKEHIQQAKAFIYSKLSGGNNHEAR